MRRTLAAAALAGAAILSLTGCGDSHEGEHCVDWSTHYIPVTHTVGKTKWVQITEVKSCNKWVPNKGS